MSDRIPGSSWDNPIWHRGWRIFVGEPSIHPALTYAFVHDDYDGAEDANDHRCGHSPTVEAAKREIDIREDEDAEEAGHITERAAERKAEIAERRAQGEH